VHFTLWGKSELVTTIEITRPVASQPTVSPAEITDFSNFTESALILLRFDGLVTKASWQRYLDQLSTDEAKKNAKEHFAAMAKEIRSERKSAASLNKSSEAQIASIKDKDSHIAQTYDAVVRLFSNNGILSFFF